MASRIPQKIGKYQIERVIGRGSMGVVYLAHDSFMERKVAIKTLRTDLAEDEGEDSQISARFRGEAKAYGRLLHPNIVTCYSYDETDDLAYIVLEYIEGMTLKAFFLKGKSIELSQSFDIIREILTALKYAHSKGVIHRDIKPANLMFSENGQIKVTDFGIARIDTQHLTHTGSVVGSPGFMSPEQFTGRPVDRRTDLFSVAVIFYQLLTRQKPFRGSDLGEILHSVLSEEPQAPSLLNPSLAKKLDSVVLKALSKKPEDRYQSAEEFIQALNKVRSFCIVDTQAGKTDELDDGDETLFVVEPNYAPEARVVESKGLIGRATMIVLFIVVSIVAVIYLFNVPNQTVPEDNNIDLSNIDENTLAKTSEKMTSGGALGSDILAAEGGSDTKEKIVTASLSLTSLKNDIKSLVNAYDCAKVDVSVAPGHSVTLSGYLATDKELASLSNKVGLLPGVTTVFNTLEVRPRPFCELVEILTAYKLGEFSVFNQNESLQFSDGEYLILDIISPNYEAYIYVDYFLLDGTVVHLLPNAIESNNHFFSRTAIDIGGRNKKEPRWAIGPPFGREMISFVASDVPLFTEKRPEVEPAKVYLKALNLSLNMVSPIAVSVDYTDILTQAN